MRVSDALIGRARPPLSLPGHIRQDLGSQAR